MAATQTPRPIAAFTPLLRSPEDGFADGVVDVCVEAAAELEIVVLRSLAKEVNAINAEEVAELLVLVLEL